MVSHSEMEDEAGCGVLYALELFDGRPQQPGEDRVSVVQTRQYERMHELCCELLPDETANLPSRRNWFKHVDFTLATCFFMLSSKSSSTPRSRTTADGWMVTVPTVTVMFW